MKLKSSIKKSFIALLILSVIAGAIVSYGMLSEINKTLGGHVDVVDTSQFTYKYGKLAIKDITLLSEDGNAMLPNQNLLIQNNSIVALGDSITIPDGYEVVEGSGKFLIPGLIDSHVHIKKSKNDLLLYLANGITYIGEMTGMKEHFTYAQDIKDGTFLGPRMYIASPKISSQKGLKATFRSWFERRHQNFTTEIAIRKAVRNYKAKGYKAIKLSSDLYEKKLYLSLIDEAKKENIPVIGHLPVYIYMEDLYTSGQSQLSHIGSITQSEMNEFGGVGYTNADKFLAYFKAKADSIAIKLKQNDITLSSTLWIHEHIDNQDFELEAFLKTIEIEYQNPGWLEGTKFSGGWLPGTGNSYNNPNNNDPESKRQSAIFWDTRTEALHEMTRALIRHGVTITAGTDAHGANGVVPGFSLHDELESLANVGMPNNKVLRSTTQATAEWMQINTGKIAVGRDADLVILDKNPLNNIKNTKAINAVITNGKYLNRNTLNQMLQAVKEANNTSREVSIDEYLD